MSHNESIVVSLHRAGGETIVIGTGAPNDKITLLAGSQGLDIAPVSFDTTPILAGHGSHMRGSRLNERKIFIPVLIEAPSFSELNTLRARIMRVVNPLDKRELTLRISVAGRTKWREIPVHYAGGLEGNYGSTYGGNWQSLGLEFMATEALWRGQHEHIEAKTDQGTKGFLQPAGSTESFLPIILADSTINDQLKLQIAGDAETFPVWTITPPGSDLTISHTNSGVSFKLTGILTEPITIDMARGTIKSATYPNNELWERVTETSDMFALQPGTNYVDFALFGSTTDSQIHVVYQPRYLGGHT